jgi:Uma2 family endonuclease
MTTALVLGPTDHGRPMTREEFDAARGQEGHRFELIEGKVYVSPAPNLPHDRVWEWIAGLLHDYSRLRPDVINYVTPRARVIVPEEDELTFPEPDLAAYQDFPRHRRFDEIACSDVSPVLVSEIVSEDNPEKDLERNVDLYQRVPSIREYWVLDPRDDPERPTLRVHRRRGQRWQRRIDIAPGQTYTTRLLPDFALLLDPRA